MRTKSETPTVQSTAQRALQILKVLRGHTITGLSNKQLADALGAQPSAITLSLNTLEAEGFVIQLENGRYAHSVALLQIAQAHADHVTRMQSRISELNARVAAGAMN